MADNEQQSKYLYDGFASILGGMNAGVAETFVPPGQISNGINLACRGGRGKNRPGFIGQYLNFQAKYANDGVGVVLTYQQVQANYEGGYFQGAGEYRYQRQTWFYALVSGKLYRFTPTASGWDAADVTPDGGNDPTRTRAYFCQAEDVLIIQDGQSVPLLVKSLQVYRSDIVHNQMPIGTFMCYSYGRTVVCVGPRSYKVSDLIGEEPDAPTYFNDDTYLAENSQFNIPPSMGDIVGITSLNIQDTATGQGPVLILGENGIESLDITKPRPTWQTSSIQVEALTNTGSLGPMAAVNGDLWFHSQDGWRSYRQARSDQNRDNQVPQSVPVRPYVDAEYQPQVRFGSAISFNNRLIVTNNPQRCAAGCVHAGLLSLDFDVMTNGVNDDEKPAWDGFWNGVPVSQLIVGTFSGQKRAFAFASNITFDSAGAATAHNTFYEIIEDAGQDTLRFNDDTSPVVQSITSTIETRALNGSASVNLNGLSSVDQLAFFTEKRLEFCDVFESQRKGDTLLTVEFRTNGSPTYTPMASFTEAAPQGITFNSDGTVSTTGPLETVEQRSFTPADGANSPSDTRIDRRFFYAVFRITFTGNLQIERFRFAAITLPDSRRAGQV